MSRIDSLARVWDGKTHRIITGGPRNVRDWRITCLCGERITGPGVKETKRRWEAHAKGDTE